MNNISKLACIGIGVLSLSGCMDVASTSAQAVYNRHGIQKNLHDQNVTRQVFQALNYKTNDFQDAHIVIATYNNEILLTGQVPKAWQKEKAEQIAKAVPSIGKVYNLLTVAAPTSSLTHMSDGWITTKIKTRLMAASDVDASQIKVITENGTVYLMGIVPVSDAKAATEVARKTDGVERVVRLFSYITLSKKMPEEDVKKEPIVEAKNQVNNEVKDQIKAENQDEMQTEATEQSSPIDSK